MDKNIGIRIKERRKALHLTQLQLKEATGLSSGHVSEIENGKILPSSGTLCQLSTVLNCSVDWILTGNSPVSENLDKEQKQLLELFSHLNEQEKQEVISFLEFKLSSKRE